jgi:hypothetical protein
MATVTNTYTSAAAKNNREDLSNVIDNITPTATPLLSLAGSRSISNVTFDWLTDSNAAPDTANAQSEGFTFTPQITASPDRLHNTAQIVTKNATVSRTQEKINAAGRSSEMSYQMAKRAAELKTSIDAILSGKQARSNGDPRKSRGLEHFLSGGASNHGAGYVAPVDEFGALTDETATRSFTEALLLDTMQALYEDGGEPNTLLLSPYCKRKFSGFAGRAASRVKVDEDTVTQGVDWYLSDFGEIKAVISRNIRGGTAALIDPTKIKTAWLRKYEVRDEPVAGDVLVKSITAEVGLEVTNPAGHAVITGLPANAAQDPDA